MPKYLSLSEAKKVLKNKGLKSKKQYQSYLFDNNIKNLPLTPDSNYYLKGWKGFADYLGISEETYQNQLNFERRNRGERLLDPVTKVTNKTTFTTSYRPITGTLDVDLTSSYPIPSTHKTFSPDEVISFLIEEQVNPFVIVKMISELNITDSKKINELCKYMQSKVKQLPRVNDYNTSGQR